MSNPELEGIRPLPTFITQKSGMSVALVVVIVAGIVGNVSMVFGLRNDIALVTKDLSHLVENAADLRNEFSKVTDRTQRDLIDLRSMYSDLRIEVMSLQQIISELGR